MRFVLDTGVLIDGARPPGSGPEAISSLTLAELEFGLSSAARAGRATDLRERAMRLASVRSRYGDGLPFDGAAASSCGLLVDVVLAVGRSPRGRVIDLLIAAVAHANGATLVTTQPGEFRGLEDVLPVVEAVRPVV